MPKREEKKSLPDTHTQMWRHDCHISSNCFVMDNNSTNTLSCAGFTWNTL